MATSYSTREIAERLDVDPHTLRKFLRNTEKWESPGKGGRYQIPARTFRSLKAQYTKWAEEHTR